VEIITDGTFLSEMGKKCVTIGRICLVYFQGLLEKVKKGRKKAI
jgi:hypothetical protein